MRPLQQSMKFVFTILLDAHKDCVWLKDMKTWELLFHLFICCFSSMVFNSQAVEVKNTRYSLTMVEHGGSEFVICCETIQNNFWVCYRYSTSVPAVSIGTFNLVVRFALRLAKALATTLIPLEIAVFETISQKRTDSNSFPYFERWALPWFINKGDPNASWWLIALKQLVVTTASSSTSLKVIKAFTKLEDKATRIRYRRLGMMHMMYGYWSGRQGGKPMIECYAKHPMIYVRRYLPTSTSPLKVQTTRDINFRQ